jgi:hypothetical protein
VLWVVTEEEEQGSARLGHTTCTYVCTYRGTFSRLDVAVWGLASERWYCSRTRTARHCI